jgi:hypothetical protein
MARLRPRPHATGKLNGDEAVDRHSDAYEGAFPRSTLLRMDAKFRAAMMRAGELPTTEPSRVAESLLPPRRP